MTRTRAVVSAIGLFAVWMLATYLLEARQATFLKPTPRAALFYTLVANVLIGTIGAALVIRALGSSSRASRRTASRGRSGSRRIAVLSYLGGR